MRAVLLTYLVHKAYYRLLCRRCLLVDWSLSSVIIFEVHIRGLALHFEESLRLGGTIVIQVGPLFVVRRGLRVLRFRGDRQLERALRRCR